MGRGGLRRFPEIICNLSLVYKSQIETNDSHDLYRLLAGVFFILLLSHRFLKYSRYRSDV